MTSAIGFYEISNLLRAAQILDEITPDGYEYSDLDSAALNEISASRRVYFRRIAPPVEYEFKTSGKLRMPQRGDYELLSDGTFHLADLSARAPGVYFRRAEVVK